MLPGARTEVRKIDSDTKGVFSINNIKSGSTAYIFTPTYVENSTRTSIHFEDKHFEDSIGKYLNHNCNPNTKVINENNNIVLLSVKDIKENEELTFDYNATEKKLSHPFKCDCHGILIKGYM
tara:strand:+ start:38 stop:403 length:366 start_codon:yes stop_codon:yes gene_type:complete